MTMWSRIEELTRRVGELESATDGERKRLAIRVEALERYFIGEPAPLASEDGLSERSVRSLWMGPYQPSLAPSAAPIGALEAISDVIASQTPDSEHTRQMLIASMIGPQPSDEARVLREVAESIRLADYWINRWRSDEDHADSDDWYIRKVDAALARARVATKGP